jgi:heme oxygenase (biliverdin-IX-beta and delta-forming)
MDESIAEMGALLSTRQVAALGTIHEGAPYVSAVPFAFLEDGSAFLVHVSELAAHTHDMLAEPRVSLLLMAPESAETLPQSLPRLTVLGRANRIEEDAPLHARAKARYLERFPDSEQMFGFADFSLFAIVPESLRWIGGFAGAQSLGPEALAEAAQSGKAR